MDDEAAGVFETPSRLKVDMEAVAADPELERDVRDLVTQMCRNGQPHMKQFKGLDHAVNTAMEFLFEGIIDLCCVEGEQEDTWEFQPGPNWKNRHEIWDMLKKSNIGEVEIEINLN